MNVQGSSTGVRNIQFCQQPAGWNVCDKNATQNASSCNFGLSGGFQKSWVPSWGSLSEALEHVGPRSMETIMYGL